MVAAGLVPQRPGDRVKTDRSPELEAARDLVCERDDARLERMRDRHRLSKFCLRHGRLLPTSSWTVVRRKWLDETQ